jgi:predicted ATPase/DNA-binding SARP family transcriptional activator/peroxiredoxin
VQFSLLGLFEVDSDDGARVRVAPGKESALLALLLLHANEPVSTDRLIEDLWGGRQPVTALKSLQVYVSRLRAHLGTDRVATTSGGYSVRAGSDELDSRRFEQLVSAARVALDSGQASHAEALLTQALALWRGPALADFRFESFAQAEIARLEALREAAVGDRIEARLARGDDRELLPELEALVQAQPLQERWRGQLMLCLYRCGRQAEALDSYQELRRLLVDERGIDPSSDLQSLQRAILNHDPALGRLRSGVPAPTGPLVGRRTEVARLTGVLQGAARLVTVTGAGGTGKSRLALEVANLLVGEGGLQVFYVSLAAVVNPDEVPIAIRIGVTGAAATHDLAATKQRLRERPSLLVLDDFEHLRNAVPVIAELLGDCPQLKVLVTSRASLHLSGEHEFTLDPLELEDAISLFFERAIAVRSDFDAEPATLVAICHRLDCLPLALELAAARTRLLSPEELLGRLEHSLELLTGGPRDLASRQQTMRDAIQWSYDLLSEGERRVFVRLAVFSGGCTLAAVEGVCGATLQEVEALIDNNLLRRSNIGGTTRYWMLATIREFALQQLEETSALDDACQSHADYYVALARQRVAEHDQGTSAALESLERELDNIRTALAWTEDTNPVPKPHDDGACNHLLGQAITPLLLDSSQGPIDLAQLSAQRLVLYIYPGTTRPGQPVLPGLDEVPSGLGCTPQARAFRDHTAELSRLGSRVAGLSAQTLEEQLEFAAREQMPYPIIADPDRRLGAALHLPTFELADRSLYMRVTLVAEQHVIVKVFYPVFPPEHNADEVLTWLNARAAAVER